MVKEWQHKVHAMYNFAEEFSAFIHRPADPCCGIRGGVKQKPACQVSANIMSVEL